MAAITRSLGRAGDWLVGSMRNGVVLAILGAFALGLTIGSARVNNLLTGDASPVWWASWLQNFSTELFGAFLTFLLLVVMVDARRVRVTEARTNAERKVRLIRQMGSTDNTLAFQAVEEMRAAGWLLDGSLKGARLFDASLQGASLPEVYLQEADLRRSNLQMADLQLANLQGANMYRANLQGAYLFDANLQGAGLYLANLQGADLVLANLERALLSAADLQGAILGEANLYGAYMLKTNLRGADLLETNLQGANLLNAEFDETTTLPDGSNWTPGSDIAHFTDPNHPDFWRSDDPQSPAYRGHTEDDDA